MRELGHDFTLLVFGEVPAWAASLPLKVVDIGASGWLDSADCAAKRYDAQPGTGYLIRPDQHVCARWRTPSESAVRAAMRRATPC